MRTVTKVERAGQWNEADACDRVVLDAEDRHRRRIVLAGEAGTKFLLDLPQPAVLRDGDGLVLDDGAIIRVVGLAEPLLELGCRTPQDLVRIAWHLGNRHTAVQIIGGKLRIRRDHVIEELVVRLGATVTEVSAPFDPETGGGHGHHHDQSP